MRQQEAEESDVVTGTLSVCHITAYVLIDPGAIHSFISNTFPCIWIGS